jgi:hypothetical protein
MAQAYPLYDQLVADVGARSAKDIDLKKMCATIKKIAETSTPDETSAHYREIAALIIHHEMLTTGGLTGEVPFGGKLMPGNMGTLNYMLNLPPLLQQIIAQYIELYA